MKKGWQTTKLGDVAAVQSGAGFPDRYQSQADGEIPFYKVSDMNTAGNEREMIHANNSITEAVRRELGAFLFPRGSTIFPKIGGAIATNKKRLTTRDCCVDNNVMGVIPNPERIDNVFLFYFFLAHDLSQFANEAHLPSIRKTVVEAWPIPFPPLAEQRRIVGILDEAFDDLAAARDNAERNLQDARALLDSHREGVFVSRGKDWIEMSLSELCTIKHGFAFKSEYFANRGDYILLTPGNFHESGGYRDRGQKQKYYAGDVPEGFVLAEGDLLVAMTEQAAGLLGSPILVPEGGKFLHNQRLGLLTRKPEVPWDNEFFFHVFNTRAVRKAIHAGASGVKVRHTSPSKIGRVRVAFPTSPARQKEIVSTLERLTSDTRHLASLYEVKLVELEALRKSLLHLAFTGQLGADAA